MIGGLYKSTSRLAIAAAAGLFMGGMALTPAQAADLGGDCCADLEERVAELEATTVRKRTRKTSVTLYGHVNRALLYWDDGTADDVYSVENDSSPTRLGVKGSGKALPGLTMGYQIELGLERSASDRVSNVGERGGDDGDRNAETDLRLLHVYMKGGWGKVTLGHTSQPSAGITEVDLSGTKVVATARGIRWNNNFETVINNATTGTTWGNQSAIRGHMGGSRFDIIRYDTPKIAGFVASVAWGEDDLFDVALRWAGALGDFKAAAGISYRAQNGNQNATDGYTNNTSGGTSTEAQGNGGVGTKIVAGSLGVLHSPTGLNVHFAAGQTQHDTNDPTGATTWNDTTFWYIKAGIKQNFFGIGPTALYGEYQQTNDAASGTAATAANGDIHLGGAGNYVADEQLSYWGLGVVQHLPGAAAEIYLGYRSYSTSETMDTGVTTSSQDLNMVMGGMRVKF